MKKATYQALNRGDATFYAVHYWRAVEELNVVPVGGRDIEEAEKNWRRNYSAVKYKLIAIFAEEYTDELIAKLREHLHPLLRLLL